MRVRVVGAVVWALMGLGGLCGLGWAAAQAGPSNGEAPFTSRLDPVGSASGASVGAEVRWTVRIDDAEHDSPSLSEPQLGPEWALVSGPDDVIDASLPRSARPDLVRQWTLMPLSGGALEVPGLEVTFADGVTAVVPAATIEVAGALGPDEDQARPLEGFREAPDRRIGDASSALWAVSGLLAILLFLVVWRRLRSRQAPVSAEQEPRPLDLIHSLAARLESGAEPPASVMASLGPLFRRAFDESLEEPERLRRAALTDESWADDSASAPGGADTARLIAELSAYRYGGGQPTSFAAKDAVARAVELARTRGVASAASAAGEDAA